MDELTKKELIALLKQKQAEIDECDLICMDLEDQIENLFYELHPGIHTLH